MTPLLIILILLPIIIFRLFGEPVGSPPPYLTPCKKNTKNYLYAVTKFGIMRFFNYSNERMWSNKDSSLIYFRSSSIWPGHVARYNVVFINKKFEDKNLFKVDNPKLVKMVSDFYQNNHQPINKEFMGRIYEVTGSNRITSRIWVEKNKYGIVFVFLGSVRTYQIIDALAKEFDMDVSI